MESIKYYITEKLNLGTAQVDKERRFEAPEKQDPWTEECLNALKQNFGHMYKIEHNWSGPIYFYKGNRVSMKNLVCGIYGIGKNEELLGDWGPNQSLKSSLGEKILNVINSVQ